MRTSPLLLAVCILSCAPSEHAPRRNLAVVTAKLLNLDNLVCEELVTGWGFTPDTAICQAAEKRGEVRVPTQVIYCQVGLGKPTCEVVFDLRKPAQPTPPQLKQ